MPFKNLITAWQLTSLHVLNRGHVTTWMKMEEEDECEEEGKEEDPYFDRSQPKRNVGFLVTFSFLANHNHTRS